MKLSKNMYIVPTSHCSKNRKMLQQQIRLRTTYILRRYILHLQWLKSMFFWKKSSPHKLLRRDAPFEEKNSKNNNHINFGGFYSLFFTALCLVFLERVSRNLNIYVSCNIRFWQNQKKKNVNTLIPKIELKKEFLLLPLHESRQTSPPPIEVEAGV